MAILDNILLYLLSKIDRETLEERIDELTFITFLLGVILLLASLFSLLYGAVTNSFFSQGRSFYFCVSLLVSGVSVTFLNAFLEKYLKSLLKDIRLLSAPKQNQRKFISQHRKWN